MGEKIVSFFRKIQWAIVSLFFILIVATTLTSMTYTYNKITDAAISSARRSMARTSEFAIQTTLAHFKAVMRTLKASSWLMHENPETFLENENLMYQMIGFLENNPDISGFYNGDRFGNLLDISNILDTTKEQNIQGHLKNVHVDNTQLGKYQVRRIYREAQLRETRHVLDQQGQLVATKELPENRIIFDPRTRPWYKTAEKEKKPTWTDAYLYEDGQVGITATYPVYDKNNNLHLVLSADVTVDKLVNILESAQVSTNSKVFLITGAGKILSFPGIVGVEEDKDGNIAMKYVSQVDIPGIKQAFFKYRNEKSGSFYFEENGSIFLASFTQFPEDFGKDWLIGIVTPADDFVGILKRANQTAAIISLIILILSILIIFFISKRIAAPIITLTDEMMKVKDLNVAEDSKLKSFFFEISQMSSTLNVMKQGLRSFEKFVPKELVRRLIKSGIGAELGGTRTNITVMFSDIKNFTTIAETLSSQDLLPQLSKYFDHMTETVLNGKGTVDKFIGDAVMAFWGAPEEDQNQVNNACRTLLKCLYGNKALNESWISQGKPEMYTRFGLHSGEAIVGNVGSKNRMNYTALGDTVNLASRLEGANKVFGTHIMVSETVFEQAKESFLMRPLDAIIVKGKHKAIFVYELMATLNPDDGAEIFASAEQKDLATMTTKGFDLYQKKEFGKSLRVYQDILKRFPEDTVAKLYVERIETFIKEPPPHDWDGTWKLTSK